AADDPLFVPWTDLLPGLETAYDPTSENLCVRGDLRCVDAVIREMDRRFRPLAESCDHDALFALTYLRTTEEYRRTVREDPNFFSDTAFVNHEDAVFASYYFDAYDDWHAGRARAAEVPSAWAIALQAADEHRVSGAGNILLGVNAHVNRDLPFVLAAIGLVKPDGSSRKPDHDKVNRILNRVYGPLLAEVARRFDPSISSPAAEGTTLDDTTLLQLLVSWREDAWRNAERLVAAATPAERELVAASIEIAAAEEAQSLAESTAYRDPATGSAARDAYCAEHWNDG
ncbi:MAG: DUF5995 family protein, partial [Actinomycetota bacterium]|nr:DUF5995 family protein [Actinomycetota bacterium]